MTISMVSNTKENMEIEIANVKAKQGACIYILHMLLQRLEETHSGITKDMLNGAKADFSAVEAQGAATDSAIRRFEAAIEILELINAQNQMSSAS